MPSNGACAGTATQNNSTQDTETRTNVDFKLVAMVALEQVA